METANGSDGREPGEEGERGRGREVRGVMATSREARAMRREVGGGRRMATAGCGTGTQLLGRGGGRRQRRRARWAGLANWAGQATQERAIEGGKRQVSLSHLFFFSIFLTFVLI